MPEPTHADTVAAGLQRQLDELREIVASQGAGPAAEHDAAAAATVARLAAENDKLRIRIDHLLRALDDKDREISLLKGA
ncbi:hypothetical protein IWQ56_001671 [Coemansia nantahalensis]|uniref:Uncharacterized protein n=1 Tax=Coemansia nantahalensis TaxID=2789366 RepID=A0ACC1K2V2_9FUNG|nr:hypothetical protein IWQ56_001671 [Coemansia nantahalensis]KAJ2772524.1 hypothetical protein IWQ57_001727 [Coemansia nantahalensis]